MYVWGFVPHVPVADKKNMNSVSEPIPGGTYTTLGAFPEYWSSVTFPEPFQPGSVACTGRTVIDGRENIPRAITSNARRRHFLKLFLFLHFFGYLFHHAPPRRYGKSCRAECSTGSRRESLEGRVASYIAARNYYSEYSFEVQLRNNLLERSEAFQSGSSG